MATPLSIPMSWARTHAEQVQMRSVPVTVIDQV
jgi:hypothetical protein